MPAESRPGSPYLVRFSPTINGVRHELLVWHDGSWSCSLGTDPKIAQAMLIGALSMCPDGEAGQNHPAVQALLRALQLLETS